MTTMIESEIAGYTLAAENKCTECVYSIALVALDDLGYRPAGITAWTVEGLVNAWAALTDTDRDHADSEEFPVPFSRQQAEHDNEWAEHEGSPAPRCACGNDFLGEF